jgi:hypothetical protein
MKLFGWEIKKAREELPLHYYRESRFAMEPRSRSATQKFTFGNVRVNIYGPFDDSTGITNWRFSLLKLCGENELGMPEYRRSFEYEDSDDLVRAIVRATHFIARAKRL